MSAGADWLLEIGCEELPYRVCESLLRQLRGDGTAEAPGLVHQALADRRLLGAGADAETFLAERLSVWISPRRVAVLARDVPAVQTAETSRMRGPRVGAAFDADGKPTKAGEGFARGRGVKPAQLERETFDGAEFVVAVVEAERRRAPEVLPAVATAILTGLQIPRGMRWGAKPATAAEYFRFSRPVRWLVCLYGDEVVPFTFYDLVAGAVSQGHRVLGAPLILDRADHYERHLAEQKVVVSQTRRADLIVEGLGASASGLGGRWFDPGEVMAETTYLVEWPSVHVGGFDPRHLRLPREVLITAMQSHQRYFPVKGEGERLLPHFLYVSNADPAAAAEITHGNERVLEGRLDDAEFSFDRDLAEGLEAMASRLSEVVFHARLGSLADKTARMTGLAQWLAGRVGEPGDEELVAAAASTPLAGAAVNELAAAVAAARFAKADLVSQTVIEFPTLQGTMGGVFAGEAGAAPPVAAAIAEHYRPLSTVGPPPSTRGGALVAIADKIDNIAGAWLAGEKPSGSRDPYGLRRAAMGIVRICLEYGLHLAPRELAVAAMREYEQQGVAASAGSGPDPEADVAAFVWERLEGLLLDEGLPFPLVEAALGAGAYGADLPRAAELARSFARVQDQPFFNDVVVAFTRPASLAAKAEGEAGVPDTPDPARFTDDAERELAEAVAEVRGPLQTALDGGDVEAALSAAAALRGPVDRYFDAVLVMDKDPALRANRLAQLRQVSALLGALGDFGRLPVQ